MPLQGFALGWTLSKPKHSLTRAIWASVSYGAAILFADALDRFRVFGFPLGFWFATQGSILTFVALVFVYVKLMNDLDRKYGVYER